MTGDWLIWIPTFLVARGGWELILVFAREGLHLAWRSLQYNTPSWNEIEMLEEEMSHRQTHNIRITIITVEQGKLSYSCKVNKTNEIITPPNTIVSKSIITKFTGLFFWQMEVKLSLTLSVVLGLGQRKSRRRGNWINAKYVCTFLLTIPFTFTFLVFFGLFKSIFLKARKKEDRAFYEYRKHPKLSLFSVSN